MNETLPPSDQSNLPLPTAFAFSNILEISSARKAFEIFVTEMTAGIDQISKLRKQLAMAANTEKADRYDKLFRATVQKTADHFFRVHHYAMECAVAKSSQTAVHLPYATQDQAFVRALTDSMMILRGYTSKTITITHQWDARDWCIDRLVTITRTYQEDLANLTHSRNLTKETA